MAWRKAFSLKKKKKKKKELNYNIVNHGGDCWKDSGLQALEISEPIKQPIHSSSTSIWTSIVIGGAIVEASKLIWKDGLQSPSTSHLGKHDWAAWYEIYAFLNLTSIWVLRWHCLQLKSKWSAIVALAGATNARQGSDVCLQAPGMWAYAFRKHIDQMLLSISVLKSRRMTAWICIHMCIRSPALRHKHQWRHLRKR